ncbi:hypothetical protein N7499_001374 [Penicillium canescens]|uniref:Uncharacterized protein n=1 Tax=Penicillium canescens TaxID=5083 RepID=A0AAD6I4C2_PENCN|nr:hypothetical protein N7460_012732 [Penicillium canescens]KAJ6041199.1 hypothetical protein N7444_010104 [Penicillium canescens]KAJ6101744.1 hypothetical protein N7499_001374 [Penicillium canescens]KAJ6174209.1 hypothetical protein N7485_007021 [Penicillium canescens]
MRLRHKRISLDVPVGHGGPRPAPLEDGKGSAIYHLHLRWDAIDSQGHALTSDNSIIPGLLAVGVDAGDFSNLGYAGGLAPLKLQNNWGCLSLAFLLLILVMEKTNQFKAISRTTL